MPKIGYSITDKGVRITDVVAPAKINSHVDVETMLNYRIKGGILEKAVSVKNLIKGQYNISLETIAK